MTAAVVVDASVVAKWYVPERHADRARALRDDYLDGRHDLLAPSLLPFEVVNALRYSGQYDGDRLEAASTSVAEYGIDLVPYRDLGPVADVATEADVTVYDAAYVALAHVTGSTAYTADAVLLDALDGSAYGDTAEHVRAYPA